MKPLAWPVCFRLLLGVLKCPCNVILHYPNPKDNSPTRCTLDASQFSLPASFIFRVGGTSLESNSEEIILQRVVSYPQSCSDDS